MSKKSASVKQTKVLQAAISTLPAWGWGLGAVMLVALFFTYYQMVQVQQRLVIGNHELADMRKAVTTARNARVEMVKEVSSLKENLTLAKTRLSRLEGELKDATGKLELVLAESKKHKMAAEKQKILIQKYEEEAKRAATQPAQ